MYGQISKTFLDHLAIRDKASLLGTGGITAVHVQGPMKRKTS